MIVKFERWKDAMIVMRDRDGKDSMRERDGVRVGADLTKQQRDTIAYWKDQGKHAYFAKGKLVVEDQRPRPDRPRQSQYPPLSRSNTSHCQNPSPHPHPHSHPRHQTSYAETVADNRSDTRHDNDRDRPDDVETAQDYHRWDEATSQAESTNDEQVTEVPDSAVQGDEQVTEVPDPAAQGDQQVTEIPDPAAQDDAAVHGLGSSPVGSLSHSPVLRGMGRGTPVAAVTAATLDNQAPVLRGGSSGRSGGRDRGRANAGSKAAVQTSPVITRKRAQSAASSSSRQSTLPTEWQRGDR